MARVDKINRIIIALIFVMMFFLLAGFAYAYFTADITGGEFDPSIIGEAGIMNIHYDGGPAIHAKNMFPSNAPFATKDFTVSGNNSTKDTLYYNLSLIIRSNTFGEGVIKYTLISTNTDNNGTIAPSISKMELAKTGMVTTFLGNGSFEGESGGFKKHSYKLEIYFPETGEDQFEEQGREFKAFIKIKEDNYFCEDCIDNKIFTQFGGKETIEEAPSSLFSSISTYNDNKMYKMDDDYGSSYYYRGAKAYVNNNLIFANHQWKIVRINGDGSIRLIYNGLCPNNSCTINDTGVATLMGQSPFESNQYDAKYLGYMYGGASGVESTSRAEAVNNETSSTVKTYLDNWYLNNIFRTKYQSYISDTLFCNDRQLSSEVGGLATGPGYGNTTDTTYYAAYHRLNTTKLPNIKCGQKNDRFTVYDTTIGNGNLKYPIGLLSPDEGAIAGQKYLGASTANYLYNNQFWWTLGPNYKNPSSTAMAFAVVADNGFGNSQISRNDGVRGVLNIKSNTRVTGSGSEAEPFKVFEEPILSEAILAQFGGSNSVTEAPNSLFTTINTETENTMYKTQDDYGTSYYYRGAKEHVANNLIFANHQWKIVRINGDGTVRILYNGTCPNNVCTINATGISTQIKKAQFNSKYNDAKYEGYMYGGLINAASTSRNQAVTNETDSKIKVELDAWYVNNMLGTEYESYISDTLFCNDRQLTHEVEGWPPGGEGFGSNETSYSAYFRSAEIYTPMLICPLQNDRFTVKDTLKGNGNLTYPIGLLTSDEAMFAGLNTNLVNLTNYLYNNENWWTGSPGFFNGTVAYSHTIEAEGTFHYGWPVTNTFGLRGVQNLNSGTRVTGTGTLLDPFKVI